MRRVFVVKLILAVLAGGALPLAFAPFGYWLLTPFSLAVLFAIWLRDTPKHAFLHGLAYGFASFLAGTYWTYISVHVFGEAPVALAVALMLGLVLVLALFVAVAGALAARYFASYGTAAMLVAMPALWVLTEWTRNWIFTGFGWLSIGYSQTDSWLMGYAPVLGLHAMSFAVALTAAAIVAAFVGGWHERRAALLTVVAIWGAGWILHSIRFTNPKGTFIQVALAQGDVTQDIKWAPEQYQRTLDLYRRLSFQAQGADLVIWPEVAIPNYYSNVRDYLDSIEAEGRRYGMAFMLGIQRWDPATGLPQNVLVALTQPRQFYIKRHLVPFGEYFPVPQFVRDWLKYMNLPSGDFETGPEDQPPIDIAGERIAVTICYEDVFGYEQLDSLPAATMLVNVSNDAWFGDSIAPHQHLQIARVRAAEAGRYLLRSTNTGITAVIDPLGNVVARAPQFEPTTLTAAVSGYMGSTPYAMWGNWPVILAAFAVLAIQLATTKLTIRPRT